MRILRVMVVCAAITGVSTSAFAGDLQEAIAKAVQQPATPPAPRPIPKAYLWPGAALFVGGMAVGLNGFLNNRNGTFPEFGEAESTNIRMGAAGLAAAFGGGLLLFFGKHAGGGRPSVTFGPGRVAASQKVTW
jgi:hypothetical protein